MIVRPEIAALRGSGAPQRQAQAMVAAALAGWTGSAPARALDAELAEHARGQALSALPLLAALFADDSAPAGTVAASAMIGELMSALLGALAAAPLGQLPLRHYCDDSLSMVVLLQRGNAMLSLQAIDPAGMAARARAEAVSFSPASVCERVLAGEAEAERIVLGAATAGGAELACTPQRLRAGAVLNYDAAREAMVLRRVDRALVSLKLQRRRADGAITREFRIADGALLHQAAGSARDSRIELTAALLGRMGRKDAAPLLAAIAEEQGAPGLRWQAMREALGLDSGVGYAALCRVVRGGSCAGAPDPLAAPAAALAAQLLETYPQLAEVVPCPV